MVSTYGILKISDLSEILMVDLTQFKDSDGNRVYSDTMIDKQISKAEILVFGTTKKTYRLATNLTSSLEIIPDQVLSAVEDVAELRMMNKLISDGFMQGEVYDVKSYYKELIEPLIKSESNEGELIEVTPVDDYNFY